MPATDREAEESLECAVLVEPPARDRTTAVQERGDDLDINVGCGRLWPDRPAERAENALVGLALLPERPAKGDVMCDQFVERS